MRLLHLIFDFWWQLRYQWAIKLDGWHPDDIDRHGG